jgi:hypothetical protein
MCGEPHLESYICTVEGSAQSKAEDFGDRLLVIEEVAERLRYSEAWVRDGVKAGRIPCIKFNARAWRFHWPSVLKALQQL